MEIIKNQLRTALVIFGVTGDLTKRKLIPALYELHIAGKLPDDLLVIGFARRDWTDEEMRSHLREGVSVHARTQQIDDSALHNLLSRMRYVRSTFDEIDGYPRLNKLVSELEVVNKLYYLAGPPQSYPIVVE